MTLYTFSIESMIGGYHEYKFVRDNRFVGDWLCEQEVGNPHDTHAVAVKKVTDGNLTVVGHVPQRISSICSIFSRRDGTINCSVDGSCQYVLQTFLKENLKYPASLCSLHKAP